MWHEDLQLWYVNDIESALRLRMTKLSKLTVAHTPAWVALGNTGAGGQEYPLGVVRRWRKASSCMSDALC